MENCICIKTDPWFWLTIAGGAIYLQCVISQMLDRSPTARSKHLKAVIYYPAAIWVPSTLYITAVFRRRHSLHRNISDNAPELVYIVANELVSEVYTL